MQKIKRTEQDRKKQDKKRKGKGQKGKQRQDMQGNSWKKKEMEVAAMVWIII